MAGAAVATLAAPVAIPHGSGHHSGARELRVVIAAAPPAAGACEAALADPNLQLREPSCPLAAYGLKSGAVLRLLPVEPPSCGGGAPSDAGADAAAAPPGTLPDGSPRLESPLHDLHPSWQRARAGLERGLAPALVSAGTGGCYFLRDSHGTPVAVFKPQDEEPLAANNPKGAAAPGEGLRRGLRPGEGAVREVAAYVLDHGRFAGVPATAMVALQVDGAGGAPRTKVGSLQQYVSADSDCEERGASGFPASEVHKIAILDLRLANTDRNGANILARRTPSGGWELTPIDHGCCLPDSFEDVGFEWQWWPQAEVPFDVRAREYIGSLDADRDAAALAAHGLPLRPECLRVLRASTLVLKRAAAAGLTAAQIAAILSRQQAGARSPIERMHADALAAAAAAADPPASAAFEAAYLARLGELVDALLDDYVLDAVAPM